jgi:hypothetical protein
LSFSGWRELNSVVRRVAHVARKIDFGNFNRDLRMILLQIG